MVLPSTRACSASTAAGLHPPGAGHRADIDRPRRKRPDQAQLGAVIERQRLAVDDARHRARSGRPRGLAQVATSSAARNRARLPEEQTERHTGAVASWPALQPTCPRADAALNSRPRMSRTARKPIHAHPIPRQAHLAARATARHARAVRRRPAGDAGRRRAPRLRADRHHQRDRALPPSYPVRPHSRLPARSPAPGAEHRQDGVRILDARAVLPADQRPCASTSAP